MGSALSISVENAMEDIARDCAQSLFRDYGVPVQVVAASSLAQGADAFALCGIIGFSGKYIRGSLIVAASRELLESSLNPRGSLRDWIAELSNQMLGRIKNRLIPRGQMIHQSTPAVMRGEHLAPMFPETLRPMAFASEHGSLCVWLDTEVSEDCKLGDELRMADMPEEGATLLF